MATESTGLDVTHALALLGAGVLAVPLFRRLGLGSVLGYLSAGLLLGPYGAGLFGDPQSLLHMAELGVVLFLFVIGLEMRPSKLWALRGDIFGLGAAQVLACGTLLTGLGILAGVAPVPAAIGAMGFVLSSTAVIVQVLEERGQLSTPAGQRAVAVLLLEDMSIVPLLAGVALLGTAASGATSSSGSAGWAVALALGTIAAVIAVGRWLLDPMFRILAKAGAREVMTAGALLVVLGAAIFMQWGGLSMAMGAFLAGVLLSESTFRHQLEADIEPFRGLLLGLFFVSVGMSLDLGVVRDEWRAVIAGVAAFMLVKAIGIYAVARAFGAAHPEARDRATLFAQGGEFAFVLYAAALAAGLLEARLAAVMTAIVVLSMALTPLLTVAVERLRRDEPVSLDGIEPAENLSGRVLVIGFGRFAQVVSQPLLARGVDVSLIEVDVDMIRAASTFGFKVYYGDGTRLDVLRAAGAERAEAILVCVDDPTAADRIVELALAEFPHAKLFARAFDRGHVLRLVEAGVDYQIRETFESAVEFGRAVLLGLGASPAEADDIVADVRRRDAERLALQLAGGIAAGRALIRGNLTTPVPAPLTVPGREGRALNEAAAQAMAEEADRAAAVAER